MKFLGLSFAFVLFSINAGLVSSAFAQAGTDLPGVTATCYRQTRTGLSQSSTQTNMERLAANHSQNRSAIIQSNRRGIDPLTYVWGVIPYEMKTGYNMQNWGEFYYIVERIDFYVPTKCNPDGFMFSTPDALAEWFIGYANSRSKNDPKNRIIANWKERVIRYAP
jgi:hypothetical protein